MLYRVVAVQARDAHRVRVRFADGMEGEADLSDVIGKGVFRELARPEELARVAVDPESGTICWPGGLEIAPDALYKEVAGIRTG